MPGAGDVVAELQQPEEESAARRLAHCARARPMRHKAQAHRPKEASHRWSRLASIVTAKVWSAKDRAGIPADASDNVTPSARVVVVGASTCGKARFSPLAKTPCVFGTTC